VSLTRWALFLVCACSLAAQSKRPEDLAVGKILVTPHDAPDPLFAESVIVLVQYSETGALGLMVNKRTTVPISRALQGVPGASKHSEQVFVGGPVQLDTLLALARAAVRPEGAAEVFGNIHFISTKAAMEKALAGATNPSGLRVYAGYCGWGPHQLDNEMRLGGWYIFDRSEDLTFDADPATLWTRLEKKTGGMLVRGNMQQRSFLWGSLRSPGEKAASVNRP
jgi:putative transcriptional regulator